MMRIQLVSRFALIATFLLLGGAKTLASEKLSDVLGRSQWGGIIGTWVDEDSKGASIKTDYAWKIKDRLIEITTKEGSKESVALMGVNAKNDEVFHIGADSDGGSSLGKWTVSEDGMRFLNLSSRAATVSKDRSRSGIA